MSTPKTQVGWKLSELAEAVGVSPRTVRYYVQRGLVPAPPFKGPDTVYGEEHLLRLKAIRVLQARFLPLDAIQVELARLDAEGIRALAESESASATVPPPPAPRPPPATAPPSPPPAHATGWRRWELAPGLELHLADTADAKTRDLAEHLRALIQKTQER
ncbi:helix-turn-helix domain-containing protein [Melittangium boletus]|uniref:helix-turn-helix domain-containing protein n=1 Tax=Melittangium boletus TaxID=83453 RepID=UPI000BB2F120|nr:helix-turn-helix domain-containing protein [Melittangium boletus]